MSQDTMTFKLPNGYDFVGLPGSSFIVNEIWHERCYDRARDLEPGSVVVDLGANQGIYALYAASRGAVVHAVEPEPENFALLSRNVDGNRLGDRVVPHNYAVGAATGSAELFVPRTDRACASGLVMTSREQRRVIESIPGVTIDTLRCRSITLSDLLRTEIPAGPIDLLKIDCEGAELEILKSASADDCARIASLAVETHDAYAERDLFYAVRDLGFAVTHYRKLAGRHLPRIGMLFAGRAPALTYARPVAILRAPGAVELGEDIVLDASASFSTVDATRRPTFRWSVDGRDHPESGPCLRLRAATEGRVDVTLSVVDGDLADTEERHVWCRAPVGEGQEIQYLEEALKDGTAEVPDERPVHLAIQKDHLFRAWRWRYEGVVVGLGGGGPHKRKYPKERKMSASPEEDIVNDWYRQVTFRHVRPEEDFHFVLHGLPPGSRVPIRWWPLGDGGASSGGVTS